MIIELMMAGKVLLHPPLSNDPIEIEPVEEVVAVEEDKSIEEVGRVDDDLHPISGVATGYTSYCEGCSGITASGYDLRNEGVISGGKRVVAMVLPIGTSVDIHLLSGEIIQAIVLDRGGAIKGNRIDIAFESREEALEFGKQDIKYTITGKVDVK